MAFALTIADESFQKTWDATVLLSPHGMIFHTWQWLKLAEKQSSTELLPILIHKGAQLVALYPVFLQKKGFIKIALSPPSRSYMIYLGPVIVNYESLKQNTKESVYIQIQQEVDNYIFNIKGCKYARIRSSPGLFDSRPLRWSGYIVDPLYTYRIDLTKGIENVWEQFEHKLRVKITKTIKAGVIVRHGSKEDLDFIHEMLSKRYIEQGFRSNNYKKYLHAIYDTFYPNNLTIFIAEFNGKRTGGAIYLRFKNVLYSWVGKPKTDLTGLSPNDLIHWEAIKWAKENGMEFYEIMDDGDNPRLRQFKAKWNPDLVIWYSATRYSSFVYSWAEKMQKMTQGKKD